MLSTLKSWVEIDLDAIVHNIGQIQRFIAPATVCPVVKAEAYGHGAEAVAKACVRAGVKNLSVATIEEAIELREVGIKVNILVLGPTLPSQYEDVFEYNLTISICSPDEAARLAAYAGDLSRSIKVHIALDTGMGRLGFKATETESDEIVEFICFYSKLPNIELTGVFSHFAVSESKDTSYMEEQFAVFNSICEKTKKKGMNTTFHICASGSMISSPHMHMDMVRPGAIIYGLFPSFELTNPLKIYPAMAVKARIMFINHIEENRSVGYDRTWIAKRETRTAVIMYGYADGYSTSFSNKSYVTIHGIDCPVIGRVCMDQTIIDVTDLPHITVGDIVHVIGGEGPSIMELVKIGGLSSREIQCLTTSGTRMPRVYFEEGTVSKIEWL